jgi:hypothetical protein
MNHIPERKNRRKQRKYIGKERKKKKLKGRKVTYQLRLEYNSEQEKWKAKTRLKIFCEKKHP